MVATNARHPNCVFYCPVCGQLTETPDRKAPGSCAHCASQLRSEGPARRGRCGCSSCGAENRFPDSEAGPPGHRLFAMEYHCPACKAKRPGRFFKVPEPGDLEKVRVAEERWAANRARFVPGDAIPTGDETNRLHRWGYRHYREMFNARQLLGLEASARLVAGTAGERVRNALATNLSDLLRYQNMLCRYDSMTLKSLDIFSVHGFPVGLIQCESNLLGILDPNKRICVGSGGWANIIEKFRKAKAYCDNPFEVEYRGGRKKIVPIEGEWIGDVPNGSGRGGPREVSLHCRDASGVDPGKDSLDAVFTDPPYYGNVQYAELMDFCYVWLRRLAGAEVEAFQAPSTRNARELTGNEDMGRGLDHFTQGLSDVFQRMARALKPGAPFAFTYHHNDLDAYIPIIVAILDAGLACSASFPCPAEMGASIHISGTGSSIVDTVFVCRTTGSVPRKRLAGTASDVARLVDEDVAALEEGNVKPSAGDIRCIAYGHLARMAVWNLRLRWDKNAHVDVRLAAVGSWLKDFGGWAAVERALADVAARNPTDACTAACETNREYGAGHDEISF